MIKADDEHQNRMQQGSCAENLGEFQFDEKLMRSLGETIVSNTVVV